MAFTLTHVVPWGRSLDEYTRMFQLSEADLNGRILGCGDGPASFNCEITKRGNPVISIDPIYQFTPEQIQQRIDETYQTVMNQVFSNQQEFVWEMFASPQDLGQARLTAMQLFLTDFEQGKHEGRYRTGELPTLPFSDGEFDLALCSHFLFLYSDQFSLDFHRASIMEMCRVAREVRIFPLLKLGSVKSQHIQPIVTKFSNTGYTVDIIQVPYEFQRGGNQMMKIRRCAS